MYYTIYQTTNNINQKIYIGKHQTDDLDDDYFGSGKYLKRAIKKNGIENFTKEILFIFETESEMNSKERELVTEEFCQRKDTYNICEGGQGGFGYINQNKLGVPHFTSDNSRKYIEKAVKTKQLLLKDDIWKTNYSKNISNGVKNHIKENGHSWFGKTHSEESKRKMSKPKNVGQQNSQFGTQWITDGNINRKIKKVDFIPEHWYKGRTTKERC